jgi:hypothetical protein
MHGTLPLSEDQALASLRDGTVAGMSNAALARQWGWSPGKVRHRLDRWRRNGEAPPPAPRIAKRRRLAARVAELVAAEAATVSMAATPSVSTVISASMSPAVSPTASAPPISPVDASLGASSDASTDASTDASLGANSSADHNAVVSLRVDTPARTESPVPARRGMGGARRILGSVVLASVGVTLAVVGMVETTTFATRVGGMLFASLAVCADLLVLLMPAAAAALWRRRSPAFALAAALWLVGAAATLANLSGYIGSSDDAFRAARETQSIERTVQLEHLERLRDERAAISEMRPVGGLRLAIRNALLSKRPALREALAMAERRDALEVELSAAAASLPAIPTTAIVDPSASVLSEISGATISDITLRRVRLLLLLMLPLCGGVVLSLALSILPERAARTMITEPEFRRA